VQEKYRNLASGTYLELNLNGTGPVRVSPMHQQGPAEIRDLVRPALEKVLAVRQLMSERGLDMSSAAAAVGVSFPSAAALPKPA
jgi:hypothetical protein